MFKVWRKLLRKDLLEFLFSLQPWEIRKSVKCYRFSSAIYSRHGVHGVPSYRPTL